ncbi:MAG: tetraacyldisaccharide 4'-kinase [Pseudobdellovibrionaceae bacterium]
MIKNFFLQFLSGLYKVLAGLQQWLFQKGLLKTYTVPVPVISVGNLTVGGTGKTPFTDWLVKKILVRYSSEKVLNLAIVVRSYKASLKQPALVDVHQSHAAATFGDEAVLLASLNPQIKVYSGPCKWKTAQWAVQQGASAILLDDGFQHRRLHRDLDLVMLDATENINNYNLLPAGRARESFHSVSRAHLVLLNKVNLAKPDDVIKIEQKLNAFFDPQKVVKLGYFVRELYSLSSDKKININTQKGKTAFLFCALARPEIFEKSLSENMQIHPRSLRFADHYFYTAKDLQNIFKEFTQSGAQLLITTAKDAVKIRSLLTPQSLEVWVAQLNLEVFSHVEVLYEKLDDLLV